MDILCIYCRKEASVRFKERPAWSAQIVLKTQADPRTCRVMDLPMYGTGQALLTQM